MAERAELMDFRAEGDVLWGMSGRAAGRIGVHLSTHCRQCGEGGIVDDRVSRRSSRRPSTCRLSSSDSQNRRPYGRPA